MADIEGVAVVGPEVEAVSSSIATDAVAANLRVEVAEKCQHSIQKKTRRYYKSQTQLLQSIEDIQVEMKDWPEDDVVKRRQVSALLVAKITFGINFALFCIKLAAAILSDSLSVVSSLVDSAVDLASGVLLWWSSRAVEHANPYLYPRGRRKLEPLSIAILAVVMSLASVQIIQNSITRIVSYVSYTENCRSEEIFMNNETTIFCGTESDIRGVVENCLSGAEGPSVELATILICSITIVTKTIMFLFCRRSVNPIIQTLAQDHRNDVISNTSAIVFGLIGTKLWKYADPIGAVFISLYIIINWSLTANEQIKMITGYTASPQMLNKLTWVILRHDSRILYIDDLKAFHFGSNYLVEVDIVLSSAMGIQESHDIGETLQLKLEKLANIERVFVHVDYETGYAHHYSIL